MSALRTNKEVSIGYHTDFDGKFTLDKPITEEHSDILKKFADERHEASKYPGIWCQWIPNEEKLAIVWDESEKFYEYTAWIKYLIRVYLKPWGYTLNGSVVWDGENVSDNGIIVIEENEVEEVNYADHTAQLEEALDAVLSKSTDKLPLFMGINKVLDKKLKKILNTAASNPASTAALILLVTIVTKFITL